MIKISFRRWLIQEIHLSYEKHIKITTNLIVEIITIITILNLDKSILYGCFSDKVKMNKNKDNNKSREKSVRKTK